MIPLKIIHYTVCRYFNLEKKKIFSRKRDREIVEPRHIFFYIANKLNRKKVSLKSLGRYSLLDYGTKWDHTSVLHAINSIEALMEVDRGLKDAVTEIIIKVKEATSDPTDIFINDKINLITRIANSCSSDDMNGVLVNYLISA